MFDSWIYLSRQRMIVVILAILGSGWLLLQFGSSSPAQPRYSMWRGPVAAITGADASQNALVGIATQQGPTIDGGIRPTGNPLNDPKTVLTQDYGVGTHAPANMWGAVDLAIDGDGDGQADPAGSQGHPIYATQSGVVEVSPNSVPAGNHVWIINDQFKTGFSHLDSFAVESGQAVQRGQVIGFMGSTGQSSGPHLDYQLWQMQGGQWVNLNPHGFGIFDPLQ